MADAFRFSPRANRAAEIPWQHWGPEAFALARSSDRPILLSLSAVWCHWCHVMDETSYSDPDVIAAIARDFVPIRVDNDERPDINARYNMGGWPTTAFLAPDGSILTGATYLPPPAMRQALTRLAHYYAEHRDKIEAVMEEARHESDTPLPATALDESAADALFERARTSYDERHGGFGDAPKFPQCDLLEFLLDDGLAGRHESLAMTIRTLRAMAGGGTYDRIEGGFFRYSTTADWSVPHFEKMAEDHGALLRILARLLAYEHDAALQIALEQSTAYVRATLYDAERGVFCGSQDADERYFALDAAERARNERPFVDPTSYTAWSAALAGAFAQVALVTGAEEHADIARRVLDTLDAQMRDSDGLMLRVWRAGEEPRVRGILADQCAMIAASLDAYEALGEERFFERADRLARATLAAFAPDGGAAADRIASEGALGRLALRDRPLAENASLARSLLRISEIADRPEEGDRARAILATFAASYREAGLFAASYARATALALRPRAKLTIRGSAVETRGWRRAALALGAPELSIASERCSGEAPSATLCIGTLCGAPMREPGALAAAYRALVPGSNKRVPVPAAPEPDEHRVEH